MMIIWIVMIVEDVIEVIEVVTGKILVIPGYIFVSKRWMVFLY